MSIAVAVRSKVTVVIVRRAWMLVGCAYCVLFR